MYAVRERSACDEAEIFLGAHLPISAVDENEHRTVRIRRKVIDAIALRRTVAQIEMTAPARTQAVAARLEIGEELGAVGNRRAIVIGGVERCPIHSVIGVHFVLQSKDYAIRRIGAALGICIAWLALSVR